MGEVITFYSYKGGTGRTMALANTAYLLSKQSDKPVLMIDWDLEAPGLFTYFEEYCAPEAKSQKGLIELMIKAKKTLPKMPFGKEKHDLLNSFFEEIDNYLIQLNIHNKASNLFLLKAGNEDEKYNQKIQKFNWTAFFKKMPAFFTNFAHYLSQRFDYILIDSRTGHTDIGGICTMLMPDKLVLAFTPNKQSLRGVLELGKKAMDYRSGSFDLRSLTLYPLPSRVDLEQEELKKDFEGKYQQAFTKLFESIYKIPWISLDDYFYNVQIKYHSEYAYEEKIAAIIDDTPSKKSLHKDYVDFLIQLQRPLIWEEAPFSKLESPLQAFVIYTDKDKELYRQLRTQLKIIEKEGGLIFSDFNDIPIDQWEEMNGTAVKSLRQGFDIVFKIMTPDLVEQQKKWTENIEDISEKSISILAKPTNNIDFKQRNFTPATKKSISDYENIDIAWDEITGEIRSSILDTIYDKLKPTHA